MVTRHRGPAADRLTGREADVLEAIGRRLANGEIAAEFHVSIRTVESHVAALRRKLGATNRTDLIAAAVEVAALEVLTGDDTTLIGRDDELDLVASQLETRGLVTLVGPAGVGKSRLAREMARRSTIEFRLVDLVGVEPDGVAVAVADAVGVGAAEGANIEGGLRLALAGRELLVVVDNAERVTAALADLAASLLGSSGRLRLLVTSRRRLGLAAEVVHQVGPLRLPDGDDLASVAASPAVELLVDRARAVRPEFALDEDNAGSVAALCRRLDGLPLAIELAAARLGSIGAAELEALLGDHMEVLSRPGSTDRAGPSDRHESLAAAVDWSWSSLSSHDRLVLQAAACLPGPCSLDELREVVAARLPTVPDGHPDADPDANPPVDPHLNQDIDPDIDVAKAVLDLVDQSMLEPRLRSGGPSSYRVLEMIRAVAAGLTEPDQIDRFLAAHARHHLAGVTSAVRRSRSATGWDYHDDRSRRTLLGALRWAAANDPAVGAQLLTAIAKRYELAPTVAVLDELRRVVLDHAIPDRWPTEPLAWAAVSLNYLDLAVMEQAAAVALERAADEHEEALGRWAVGFAATYLGREVEAAESLAPAERAFRDRGDTMMAGMCLMALGLGRTDQGEAVAALESALVTFLEGGNTWHAHSVRLMLARRAIEAEVRLDEVPGWLDEGARFAESHIGLHHDRAHAQSARAEWAAASDDLKGCRELATTAAEAFRHHGDLRCLVRSLLLLARTDPDPAEAAVQARRAVGAAVLQRDPGAQRQAVEAVVALAGSAEDRATVARARGALLHLAGAAKPNEGEVDGAPRTALLEGWAIGPASVALGPGGESAGIHRRDRT